MGDRAVEVLVVGAGPAGLTLSLLLARRGLSVLCIDKHGSVSPHARARGVHARAAEILRQAGAEEAMLARRLRTRPVLEFRSDLVSPPLDSVEVSGDQQEVSPCDGIAISQDDFETVLIERLIDADPTALRRGVELEGFAEDATGISAHVQDRTTAERYQVRTQYLIGADGWRSRVRTQLGIELDGPDRLQTLRGLTFRADLSAWLGDPPPGLTLLAASGSVLLPTHADHRWAFNGPALPGPDDDPLPALRAALGLPDLELDLLTDGVWTAAAQTARRFSQGRVFLIGDAAHRVPPMGATGVSSAMADAHNLAWKLSATLAGWAGPALLASYDTERRAVALTTTRAAYEMWQEWQAGDRDRSPRDIRRLDMGYRYSSAVIAAAAPPPTTDEVGYTPGAQPGDRAPHVRMGPRRVDSILDLYGSGFVLLTAPGGRPWMAVASEAADGSGVPLQTHCGDRPEFLTRYEMAGASAVLVRPDGHVAWRFDPGRHGAPAVLEQAAARTRLTDALGRASGQLR